MPFLSSLLLNQQDHDDVKLGQEIPVTSTPIFEGHLSVRTEKKHWHWRLFRFDGSNFTCLSTRKVKKNNKNISPLLSTPKDKTKRLTEENEREEIKYYQLPEWTIDVLNISSISVLKRGTSTTKCFSIRTFLGQCFILKAEKQKDLERWLFVLTKMWKFTQAVHLGSSSNNQSQQQQYYFNQQQQQQQQQQVQAQLITNEEDNIPLVHSIQHEPPKEPILLSDEKIQVIEEWRKSLAELMANDPNIRRISITPPPIEPIPDDDTMSVFTDMTSVSNRQPRSSSSLRKRSASTAKRNKINSISPVSASNAANNAEILPLERQVPILRKRRSDDVRNWMNNSSKSSGLNRKSSTTKYVLSTPISISTPTNYQYYQQQQRKGSIAFTSPETHSNNMNFFQDIFSNVNYAINDDAVKTNNDVCLKYHTSIKGKKLIIQGQQQLQQQQQQQQQQQGALVNKNDIITTTLSVEQEKENNRREIVIEEGGIEQQQQVIAATSAVKEEEGAHINNNTNNKDDVFGGSNQDNNHHSKRRTIIRRASMPLTDNNLLIQQQFLLDQQQKQKLLQPSPLEQLFYHNTNDEEEDMSLADLQKSLRKVKLNRHKRSPSASSIHDLQKQQRQSIQAYYYQQPTTVAGIVAPAIPPLQVQQQQQQYLFDPTLAAAAYYQQQMQFQQQQFVVENSSVNSKRASFLMNNANNNYNTISNNSNIYNR